MYSCAECGEPVGEWNGVFMRTCNHTGAINASMKAVATGTGGTRLRTKIDLFIRDLKRALSKYRAV